MSTPWLGIDAAGDEKPCAGAQIPPNDFHPLVRAFDALSAMAKSARGEQTKRNAATCALCRKIADDDPDLDAFPLNARKVHAMLCADPASGHNEKKNTEEPSDGK